MHGRAIGLAFFFFFVAASTFSVLLSAVADWTAAEAAAGASANVPEASQAAPASAKIFMFPCIAARKVFTRLDS